MSPKQTRSTVGAAFWLSCFMFNFSGLTNNYFANELDVKGIGNPMTGFQTASIYLSETLVAIMIMLCQGTRLKKKHISLPLKYWYLLVLDLVGQILYWSGLAFIGSGLTTLLYSSIVIWTGIFSRIFFNKSISDVRWACIFWLWASVGLSVAGQLKSFGGAHQVIGILAILISAMLFGLIFVLVDNIVTMKLSPVEIAFLFWPNLVICMLWVGIFDGMNYQRYVIDSVKRRDPDYSSFAIITLLVLFFLSNASHQISMFYQLNGGKIAAVTTGVNKILQAALVFISSDLIYCPKHHWNKHREYVQLEQCIDTYKLIGFIGALIGVLVYSFDGIMWAHEPDDDLFDNENVSKPLLPTKMTLEVV